MQGMVSPVLHGKRPGFPGKYGAFQAENFCPVC